MLAVNRDHKGHFIKYVRTHGRGGGGQVSYTFPLRIACKKGGGGPESM